MIDPEDKATAESVVKLSYGLAILDLTLAVFCAIMGDSLFVPFMLLAGLMYAYGTWLKRRMDEIGE